MTRDSMRMRRRWLLQAVGVAGLIGFAGCAEETHDPEEDPVDDEPLADDDPADTDAASIEEVDQRVELTEGFDTYISNTWVHLDDPVEETLIVYEMTTEWDLGNDRVYRRVEMNVEDNSDDEIPVMEYYMIGDKTYQLTSVGQESQCAALDGRLIRRDELREAGIRIPDAQDIEAADNVDQLDSTDIDGEPVEVWQFDLAETLFALAGEMTVYISSNTGYVVLIESWYETGNADNPIRVEFEQRNRRFNEELDIELPQACE